MLCGTQKPRLCLKPVHLHSSGTCYSPYEKTTASDFTIAKNKAYRVDADTTIRLSMATSLHFDLDFDSPCQWKPIL